MHAKTRVNLSEMKFYAGNAEAAAAELYYKFHISPHSPLNMILQLYVLFISNFAVLEYGFGARLPCARIRLFSTEDADTFYKFF